MTPHHNDQKPLLRWWLDRAGRLVSGRAGRVPTLNERIPNSARGSVARDVRSSAGFSLVELLVATTVFMFVVTGVSSLFIQALDLQRRATGIQKIEENAQFVTESIAREIRVSTITSGDTNCSPPDPVTTATLVIKHPVNGTVTYQYDKTSGIGVILRNGQPLTTTDVNFTSFAFCVSGSGADGTQARVTVPMTIQAVSGRPANRVAVSLQTTVASRDLSIDLTR